MRLVRFGGGRIGVLADGLVHDVTVAAGIDATAWPPTGMVQLIADFAQRRAAIEAAIATSAGVPEKLVRLEAPLVWPQNLLAYPVNYLAHGHEMNSGNRANINGFFAKAASSISGPSDAIVLPEVARSVHHECELGLIIGTRGRHIARDDALNHVFGYCCLIDCTVRGQEERVMRKSYDTFTPIGPALVTADEVGDPSAIRMRLWVNDELRQDANTRDLLVDIPEMITIASSVLTLEPGDIFATGTPAGVGPIVGGDIVTIEIERVGRMSIPVVQGKGGYNIAIPRAGAASAS